MAVWLNARWLTGMLVLWLSDLVPEWRFGESSRRNCCEGTRRWRPDRICRQSPGRHEGADGAPFEKSLKRKNVNRRRTLTPYRRPNFPLWSHGKLARGGVAFKRRSRIGPAVTGCSGSGLEAPTLVARLYDLAVVGEPVEQRSRHLGIAEDARPFAGVAVRGHEDRRALVDPAAPGSVL